MPTPAHTINNREDLITAIEAIAGEHLPIDTLDSLVALTATLWDNGYHAGVMDEFKGQTETTRNPITATDDDTAGLNHTQPSDPDADDGSHENANPEDAARLFTNDRCNVCGHLKGDHERFPGTQTWTCDDDCDEDLNGYCHTGRL